MCPSIRFLTSPNRPLRSLTSIKYQPRLRGNGRPDRFTRDHASQVSRGAQVEDDDRELVVHAQGDGGGVHHLEPLFQDLDVGNGIVFGGVFVDHRVGGVDAVDLGPLEDDVGFHLHRAERSGGVGGEVGIAGAGGEEHYPALFQFAAGSGGGG